MFRIFLAVCLVKIGLILNNLSELYHSCKIGMEAIMPDANCICFINYGKDVTHVRVLK